MNSGTGEAETRALAGAIHDREFMTWVAMTELWRLRWLWQNYCLLQSPNLCIFDKILGEAITDPLGQPRLKSGTC